LPAHYKLTAQINGFINNSFQSHVRPLF